MRSNLLEPLQKELSPQTSGLIWFSDKPLKEQPVPFDELDYFLDGLLSKTVQTSSAGGPEHYFVKSSQFSKPFYLIYFGPGQTTAQIQSSLSQDLELMGKMNDKKILILNAPDHIKKKQLGEKFNLEIQDLKLL